MEVKKIFNVAIIIVLFIGLCISLYWNYLTAARLENLAQDVRYSFEDLNSQEKIVPSVNCKDLELRVSILEGKAVKKPLADYSNQVKMDELENRVNKVDKQSIFGF